MDLSPMTEQNYKFSEKQLFKSWKEIVLEQNWCISYGRTRNKLNHKKVEYKKLKTLTQYWNYLTLISDGADSWVVTEHRTIKENLP